ncbi:hypothetical protein GCM10010168_31050 [Actinoplanes ianthinogenes]|uniref:Diguanylate cyclase n=1 Tax=Actinoplanes ianthinogenes TaxID=122358 RepID=A0ABM7LLW6_9ACTN|nr:GGDEF domain-containing protein [Actinoplanes ianthinogenes]BCJ40247.1 hypothetical protein Aiant_09040 [Actinoplanes ianthinogenes]GGR11171.1 hypothetical protein GCM10010168_31050 [Actinoplanes ianthinogenes]
MTRSTPRIEVTIERGRFSGLLADRSLRAKNMLCVLVVAAVAVGVGALSINRMANLNDDLRQMKTAHVESTEDLAVIRQGVAEDYRGLMLWWGSHFQTAYGPMGRAAIASGDAMIDEALGRYRVHAATSPSRMQAVKEYTEVLTRYRVWRSVVEFGAEPPAEFTLPARDQVAATYMAMETQMNQALQQLQEAERADAEAMAVHAQRAYDRARLLTGGALGAGLLVALLFAWWLGRRMRLQLGSVAASLAAVAGGDLSRETAVLSRDELGAMAVAVNKARHTISELQDRLRFDATHDPLTGLANRALFDARIRATPEATVLLIDLDDFKPVNDVHGHHVGDELLRAVADRLRGCVREGGTVARLGGDEFAVLFPQAAGRSAELAAGVLEAFAAPVPTSAGLLPIRASIGAAGGSTADPAGLMRRADEAMYEAKRNGKNATATAH